MISPLCLIVASSRCCGLILKIQCEIRSSSNPYADTSHRKCLCDPLYAECAAIFLQRYPAANREQVQRHRQLRQELLLIYSQIYALQIDAFLCCESARNPSLPYWRMTIRYGQLTCEALIRWCDETLKVLDTLGRKAEKRYKRAEMGLIPGRSNIRRIRATRAIPLRTLADL